MNWTEQIAAVFSWLPKDPDIIWDGWGTYVVSIFLSLAGAAALWFIARFRKPNTASIQHDASDWLAKNRLKLRRRFQKELDDRRHSFLLGKEPLELDKILAPQEVAHPHSLQDSIACTLERDGLAVETTGQPIAALFNRPEVGRRLAILGEPGSGKTVCLLNLCGHLLQEAAADESAPLPVIFECSEWDSGDLLPWMASQLHRKYQFQEETARQLVQARDIFPLFDGLDELAAAKQEGFVRHFNEFAEGRHVVLCCRLEEYRQLRNTAGQKLALSNAAILQDIAPARLEEHLRQQELDELWNLLVRSESEANSQTLRRRKGKRRLKTPQSLLQLARRPLFLGLITAVAKDLCQGSVLRQGESEEDFLWRLYLNDCLAPTTPDRNQSPDCYGKKYNKEQSLHWLRCLAKWMQAEQKVELRIDELQPSMLKGYWRFGLLYGLSHSLLIGITYYGISGLVLIGALFGMATGLWSGLPGCLSREENVKLLVGLIWWRIIHLILGPISGLFAGLFVMLLTNNERKKIKSLRPLRLPSSWQDIVWMLVMMGFGLFGGAIYGVFSWWNHALFKIKGLGLKLSMVYFSFIGLAIGLLVGLAQDLLWPKPSLISETAHPQQRLNDALRSGLLFLFFPLVTIMLLFMLVLSIAEQLGITVNPFYNKPVFYTGLFPIAIFCFFFLGANQVLQHYLLRLCLRWEGQLPLRFVSWLEAMQQRKVLQQVGGSYHFLHKQLQEYLAKSKVA